MAKKKKNRIHKVIKGIRKVATIISKRTGKIKLPKLRKKSKGKKRKTKTSKRGLTRDIGEVLRERIARRNM